MLYLGTENGIYVSFNNGDSWQSLQAEPARHPGLTTSRSSSAISSSRPTAGPCTSWTTSRRCGSSTTRSRRRPSISSSPSPRRRGLDANVSFDYSLKAAAQRVTIEVLDAKGQTIKTFNGVPEPADKKPEAPPSGDDDFRQTEGSQARGDRGNASAQLGHALSRRHRIPRPHHVGGELSRTRGPSRDLHGPPDRGRCVADRSLSRSSARRRF